MGERADKKHQSKPTVSMVVLEVVDDASRYLRVYSDGEAARRIAVAALDDVPTINRLAPYMWRDYARGDLLWHGHDDKEDLRDLLPDEWTRKKRLSVRFHKPEWNRIVLLAFALAEDKANTVAALLRLGIESDRVLQVAAPGYRYRSAYSLRKGVFG